MQFNLADKVGGAREEFDPLVVGRTTESEFVAITEATPRSSSKSLQSPTCQGATGNLESHPGLVQTGQERSDSR